MTWSSNRSPRVPSRRWLVGSAALTVGLVTLLAGCSGAASMSATGVQPGAGQSLAGMPGATVTASASPGAAGTASTSPTAMPSMSMPAAGGQSAAAKPVSGTAVAIKGFAFSPATLMVKVGTKVTWTNQDADAHTVTSDGSGGPLKSVALSTGQTYSYTFTTAGSYSYLCTIHPFMTAKVVVTQ